MNNYALEAAVVSYIAKKLGVKWGLINGNTYQIGDDVLMVDYQGGTIEYWSCDKVAIQEFAAMQPNLIKDAVRAAKRNKKAPEAKNGKYPLTECTGAIHRALFDWRGKKLWAE